jgi:hypothetical protein
MPPFSFRQSGFCENLFKKSARRCFLGGRSFARGAARDLVVLATNPCPKNQTLPFTYRDDEWTRCRRLDGRPQIPDRPRALRAKFAPEPVLCSYRDPYPAAGIHSPSQPVVRQPPICIDLTLGSMGRYDPHFSLFALYSPLFRSKESLTIEIAPAPPTFPCAAGVCPHGCRSA